MLCLHVFQRAVLAGDSFTSPRAGSFAMLGIHEYLKAVPGDLGLHRVLQSLGQRLMTLWKRSARRFRRSSELRVMPHGRDVAFAGLVTLRQRPQTASGVTFLTLEDEDGLVNVVVWRQIADEQRRPLLESRLLAVEGRLESKDGVQHLIARRLTNLSTLLGPLAAGSRDFR